MRLLKIREEMETAIRLEKLESLFLHEKTSKGSVDELYNKIKRDKIQKDPIIVEKENYIVLDGTHRVMALKKLGYTNVLCYFVPYNEVRVDRWYRLLSSNQPISSTKMIGSIEGLDKFTIEYINDAHEVKRLVDEGNAIGALITKDKSVLIKSKYAIKDIIEVYNHLTVVEDTLRMQFAMKTIYCAHAEIERKNIIGVLAPPIIDKTNVIMATRRGVLFPLKSTRHILKIRPLSINLPISFLQDEDIHEKNENLKGFLQQKNICYLPRGTNIEGRTYEEAIIRYV